jgi:hypothetical protein
VDVQIFKAHDIVLVAQIMSQLEMNAFTPSMKIALKTFLLPLLDINMFDGVHPCPCSI